jgi:hypothetical protein
VIELIRHLLGVLENVVTLDPLIRADRVLYHLLQGMRGPQGDRVMAMLSELGDAVLVSAVVLMVVLWLILRRA